MNIILNDRTYDIIPPDKIGVRQLQYMSRLIDDLDVPVDENGQVDITDINMWRMALLSNGRIADLSSVFLKEENKSWQDSNREQIIEDCLDMPIDELWGIIENFFMKSKFLSDIRLGFSKVVDSSVVKILQLLKNYTEKVPARQSE